MPEIEIRPAAAADIPALVELEHDYTSDYVWQMDLTTTEENEVTVRFRQVRLPRSARVDYPRSRRLLLDDWEYRSGLLVAVYENQLIGYTSLMLSIAPNAAWMTDLVVARRMRRQGVGRALVLAALEWARRQNSQRLVMELQPKNYPAARLAYALGFEFCGYQDRYYSNKDTALFFARFLG